MSFTRLRGVTTDLLDRVLFRYLVAVDTRKVRFRSAVRLATTCVKCIGYEQSHSSTAHKFQIFLYPIGLRLSRGSARLENTPLMLAMGFYRSGLAFRPTCSVCQTWWVLAVTMVESCEVLGMQCWPSFAGFCCAMLCINAAYTVARWPSVCPSVAFVYSVETSKHIFKNFPPSGIATPF